MVHAFGLYRRLIAANIRSQMSYRISFWLESLASFVSTITVFLTLALILERFNNIAGWTLWEVAFLYGMVESAFGVMDMLFSGQVCRSPRFLERIVIVIRLNAYKKLYIIKKRQGKSHAELSRDFETCFFGFLLHGVERLCWPNNQVAIYSYLAKPQTIYG